MPAKIMLKKGQVKKALKRNDTQEGAAEELGISRMKLYNFRVENNMPIADRG